MKNSENIGMKKIESFATVGTGRRGILVFDSPINRIIIRGHQTLMIVDSITFEEVKAFKTNYDCYCTSKRNFNSFLAPTISYLVECYTILPPYNDLKLEKKIKIDSCGTTYDIHAFSEDKFVTYNGGNVQVCSYKLEKVLKVVEVGATQTWLKMMLPSKSFKDSVFLHQDQIDRCIRLFNYERIELVRDFQIFKEAKFSRDIMCMDSYVNNKNHEILIAGGKELVLLIYNLTEDKLIEELSVKDFVDNFSILAFGGKYFVVGNGRSLISLYEFNESKRKSKKIKFTNVCAGGSGSSWIMEAKLFKRIGNDARVVFISSGGVSELWEFTGVFEDTIKDKQWNEDCNERKEFLISSIDDYLPNEDEKKGVLCSLKLKNNTFENCLKIFFL